MRNQNEERADGINFIGNPEKPERLEIVGEHLKNPFPENVMEIENDSDAKESEIMEINNNDENDDDSKNNR